MRAPETKIYIPKYKREQFRDTYYYVEFKSW